MTTSSFHAFAFYKEIWYNISIFDDLWRVDENGNLSYNGWVEWDHFFIQNKPGWFREILRNLMVPAHCLNCTALDGCYLLESNSPEQPLHEHCDCKKKDILFSKVKNNSCSECDISKFTEYVFKKQ